MSYDLKVTHNSIIFWLIHVYRTLNYIGIRLQIKTWLESYLIGTHTTSSDIYILFFFSNMMLPWKYLYSTKLSMYVQLFVELCSYLLIEADTSKDEINTMIINIICTYLLL